MPTVKHTTAVTGTDNPAYQVSKDEWNADHETVLLSGSSAPDAGDSAWVYFQQTGGGRFLFVNVGTYAVPDWQTLSGLKNNATGAASVTTKDTSNLVALYGEGVNAALEINIGPVGHLGADVLTGTADPSAGAGFVAPVPALFLRDNSGVGELWLKVGNLDTQWTKIL